MRPTLPRPFAALALAGGLAVTAVWVAGPWRFDPQAGADETVVDRPVEQDPVVSGDGRRVVYVAPSTPIDEAGTTLDSVWLLDRSDGTRTQLTMPSAGIRPGRSRHPVASDDGCSIAVVTELALDLFRDDDRGNRWDVYRTVLPSCPGGFEPGEWELVSSVSDLDPTASDLVDPSDRIAIDGSGQVIAYTRLSVPPEQAAIAPWTTIEVADLTVPAGTAGRLTPVPARPAGPPTLAASYIGQREPALSGDGRYLVFTTDTIVDVVTDAVGVTFTAAWTDHLADGVAVTQVVRWDRAPSEFDETPLVETVSIGAAGTPGNAASSQAAVDADGDVVVFASLATDLLSSAPEPGPPPGVGQVYRRAFADPVGTTLVSTGAAGPGDAASGAPSTDGAGRLVAFESSAGNLVSPAPVARAEPTGADLLLADTGRGIIERITTQVTGLPQPYGARHPRLSDSGRVVVFQTVATELPPGALTTAGERTAITTEASPPPPDSAVVEPGPAAVVPWHVAISAPPVSLSVSELDLGTADLGTSTRTWFTTLVNAGPGAFVPASITTSTPEFTVTGGTCQRSVPVLAGESCTVEVIFTASAEGPVTGELIVSERGFDAAEIRAGLTAVGGRPNVAGVPSSVDFGSRIVMLPSEPEVVTFANNGVAETGVAALSFGGTHPDDFSVVADECTGRLLSIGESCIVRLAFTPTAAGPRSATITATATSGATAGIVLVGDASYTPLAGIVQTQVTAPGRVDVVGLGFPIHAYVTIGWEGDDRTVIALTDERGELHTRLDVPRALGGGRRVVQIVDPAGQFDPVRTTEAVIAAAITAGGASPAHRNG